MLQPLLARLGIAAALVAAAWLHGCHYGGRDARQALEQEQRDHRATKGFYARVLKDAAARAQRVAEAVAAANRAVQRYRAENDRRFQEQADASQHEIADLRRRLRAGAVQLQPWWACPAGGTAAGDAAAPAGGHDGYAEIRRESALEAVSDADHADRWVGWLQSELTNTRQAMVAAGCAVVEGEARGPD